MCEPFPRHREPCRGTGTALEVALTDSQLWQRAAQALSNRGQVLQLALLLPALLADDLLLQPLVALQSNHSTSAWQLSSTKMGSLRQFIIVILKFIEIAALEQPRPAQKVAEAE